MALSIENISAMFGVQQEGPHLDFKAGAALDLSDKRKAELVKDVTGFANAGGGTIIYGVCEETQNNIGVASGFAPVSEPRVDKEWISQVVRNKTSPALLNFDVMELQVEKGRVVVVEIPESYTAHQSLHDHRFYIRAGATTQVMEGYQVRDVMNRRMTPIVSVRLERRVISRSQHAHHYEIVPILENIGSVLLEKWLLELDMPGPAASGVSSIELKSQVGGVYTVPLGDWKMVIISDSAQGELKRMIISDPLPNGVVLPVHPRRAIRLDSTIRLSALSMHVDDSNYRNVHVFGRPIRYRLYTPTSMVEGEMPFENWCDY